MKVLRTWNLDGKLNMSLDVVLSECAEEPILRFYTWAKPTLSLGRHQKRVDLDFEYLKRKDFDCVVRPTGGRAVLHWEELTYSIIIPANHELYKKTVLERYLLISECICTALESLGYNVNLEKTKHSANTPACFDSPSIYELTIDGKKIVGSAQMKTEKAILQHGSIILKPHLKEYARLLKINMNALENRMSGLYEYKYIDIGKLCLALENEFEKLLGKAVNLVMSNELFLKAWQRRDEFIWLGS